jgi:FtsH-binding integral membrane protein
MPIPERNPWIASRAMPRSAESTGFLQAVYGWMAVGLSVTALLAAAILNTDSVLQTLLRNPMLIFGLFLGELALVVSLSAMIQRLSVAAAGGIFLLYSALNGVTLSVILFYYTTASVASTFFITAGTFAATSFYGYTTKRDLSSLGSLLFMGLIGIILASVVNIFLRSPMVYWIVTYAGVAIFVGLTAHDTQKLKEIHESGVAQGEEGGKLAIHGALRLYLDFINLFLFLLRILGRRR